jgi:peptidoglycan/xylan/chitin deacetylase (PgdA/CDA1 family)
MIHRTPFFLPWLYPSLIWRVPTQGKDLYLTFDDGPVPGPTEFVLDTLEKFGAKATFFCIGENIKKHPVVFRKILEARHTIGNHTFNHLNGWKSKTDDYKQNFLLCQNEIAKHGQTPTTLFRPPYGRISRDQIRTLSDLNIVMWDVLAVDYDKSLAQEKCLRNTISATRSGSIIVFHDSYKAERNLKFVLPRLIEHFSLEGFTFKAIASS